MITSIGRRAAVVAGALVLALGASACTDSEAVAKAEAEAQAKAEEGARLDKLKKKLRHNVECLSAIRWQRTALSRADVGDPTLYEDYFRGAIDKAIGSAMIPAEPPLPMLSRATLPDYLTASYPVDVEKFRRDDGRRGIMVVSGCIQEVAEMGEGPLAGPDKVGRTFKMEAVRKQLKDKEA